MTTPYGLPFNGASFPITSPYGPRPVPTPGASAFHWGYDFGTPLGTPLYAPAAATIDFMGQDTADLDGDGVPDGLGNYVRLLMPGGETYYMGHLDSFAPGLEVGATVDPGTLLAYSGNSGIGTGAHVDIRMRDAQGNRIDPTPYLGLGGVAGHVDPYQPPVGGRGVSPVDALAENAVTDSYNQWVAPAIAQGSPQEGQMVPTAPTQPGTGFAAVGASPAPNSGMSGLQALMGQPAAYPYSPLFDIGQALMMGASDRNPFPGIAHGLGQAAERRAQFAQQGGGDLQQRIALGQAFGLDENAMRHYVLTGELPGGVDPTSAMQNFEYLMALPPDQRQAALESGVFGSGGTNVEINTGDAMGTIPPGYRVMYDEQGRPSYMEPIPGSEAERELRATEERETRVENTRDVLLSQNLDDIDRALTLIDGGTWTTGLAGALTSAVPGTDAYALSQILGTIGTGIGFEELARMRSNSPTGAGLGNITEGEREALNNVRGSLAQAQTASELTYNLIRYRNMLLDLVHGAGQGPPRTPLPARGGASGSSANPAPLPENATPGAVPPGTPRFENRDGVPSLVYPDGTVLPLFRQ